MKPLSLIIFGILVFNLFTNYADGPPSGVTGSPGDKGATCKQSGCHIDAVLQNATTTWITSNVPAKGFVKDSTYTITITARATHTVNGFCVSAQNKTGTAQGSMIVTNTQQTQYADAAKAYIIQTRVGSSGTNKVWTFNWKAPSTLLDSTTIYACVMAANGNANENGDSLFLSNLKLTRAALAPTSDIVAQVKVQVAPNPAHISAQNVSFTFAKPTVGVWNVRLYTLYGALVGSQKVWNTGDISVSMPLNNLLNGIFAYSITDDTETIQATGKLVVSE